MPSSIFQAKAATNPSTRIPAFNLTRQYESIKEEVRSALERVLTSQHFIGGPELEQFESEAAQYLGVDAVVGCASGTDALWLALQAGGIGSADSVLTSPFSFFASASSIERCGAKPVFADIDPATLNLDPVSTCTVLRTSAGESVKAIVPVHLYGQCADMGAFLQVGQGFRIPVIEDAAQAFGARWRDRMAGNLGDIAAFSFYPTKNLGAYGEAGCVTTNDADVAAHLRRLRNHGSKQRYYHEEFGWNSRLDGIQAAILRVKLRHLDTWNEQRRTIAERYAAAFERAGLTRAGHSLPEKQSPIVVLQVRSEAFHIFHQFVVRALKRDELREFLSEHGIGTEIYYPVPLHLQQAFAHLGYQKGAFPEAERAAEEALALPMFPELTEEEQQRVTAVISEFHS
jgi:dTDP-4-amino-4,6-dideoxygalactose transaminase